MRFFEKLARLRNSRVPSLPPKADPAARLNPPITGDIKRWCEDHEGSVYRVLAEPETIHCRPPRTLEPEVHPAFQPYFDRQTPEKALLRISNARLAGSNGLVILPDGTFVGQLIANGPEGWRTMLAKQPAYYSPLPQVHRKEGSYFSLMVIGWQNYYHWNHDVIIKLHWVLDHLPGDIRFIAPPNLKPFHYDTLKLLGIRTDQLCYFQPHELWEVESLYFVVPYPKPSMDTLEPLAWFKERSQSVYGVAPRRPFKRIFLSRLGDTHFRTVNERAVARFLSAYGFETLHPGHMSFSEQVELFSSVEAVVGTGTGLFNMVFASPGARILQLQEPTHMVLALWTLSEALGHSYWYLCADTVPNRDYPDADADLFVQLPKLKITLANMLEETDSTRA